MKKNMAIVVLVITTVVFAGLWMYEKNDRSELEQLCQISAAAAWRGFSEYQETGADGHYWEGVANFRAFLNSWVAVEGETPAEYSWFNSVYGFMVLSPEKVQACMDELLTAMEIVGTDYTNPNGPLRISELNNLLIHE